MNDPSRPTILIVDDSPTMRAMISTALTEGGYRVVEAADGKDGLARLQLHAVQLILTDVNMPRMDGLAFLQSLRQDPRFARTPVLMLTTESSQEMKGRGKAAGATGWIVKPFRPEDLRQVVGKVLAGPSSRQPAAGSPDPKADR
jgi:two-component system chemotaxis response regulator CheY